MRTPLFVPLTVGIAVLMAAPAATAEDAALINPVEQIDFANGLFQKGFYKMAISEYKKFIKLFPESEYLDEARFGIAESLFFGKSYKEAIEAYEEYITLFPEGEKAAVSRLRVGESSLVTGEYDEALRRFTEAEKALPAGDYRERVYFYTGKAYRAMDDNTRALEYFKKSVSSGTAGGCAVYALMESGDIFSERGEYKEAARYYRQAFDCAGEDEMSGLALYRIAEMEFLSGDYADAAESFRKVLYGVPDADFFRDSFANMLLSLFNLGEYKKLLAEYDANIASLDDEAEFFDIHYIAACAYAELGRFGETVFFLDEALASVAPESEEALKALLKKAETLIRSGRFKEALGLIKKELKFFKEENDQIIFLEAEVHYGLGDFKRAYALYKDVIVKFPETPFLGDALYGMAYSKKSLGKDEEALELFLEYYRDEKNEKKRREALYSAILIEARSGSTEDAIAHSEEFLSTFGEGPLGENVLFRLASLYSEAKMFDEAVETLRRFIGVYKESPRVAEAYFLIGYNCQLSKRFDEAVESYDRVPPGGGRDGLHYSALKNKSLIFFKLEDNERAAAVFDKIVTEFDDNDLGIEGYFWLAKHYIDAGRFEDVLRVARKARSRSGWKERGGGISYFEAEAHRGLGDFKKAVERYDDALSYDGEDVYKSAARIGKGMSLIEINDLKAAKAEFEKVILEYPDDSTVTVKARFEMADIERRLGNLEGAAKLYMLVVILYEDDRYCPEALFKAGGIFEETGKLDEAAKAYADIVDIYKESSFYEKAKERLRELSEAR